MIIHSDGAITPFLQRFIEIGADAVHPLEPLPATDMAAVKAHYGDQLVFLGGIDIRTAMQGDEEGVEAEVRRRIELLVRGAATFWPQPTTCRVMCPLISSSLDATACEHGGY